MKKFCLIILFGISIQSMFACDICGCSTGNYFIGLTPQFSNQFIGIRYTSRSFKTVLKTDKTQFSNDFYQTTEIWGGYKISPAIQVLAFLPYNINNSVTDDGLKTNNGIGDVTLLGSYRAMNLNTWLNDSLSVRQKLWFGGGVKLPTGVFLIDTAEVVSSANSQSGSGSLDFIVTGNYDLQIGHWGLTSNLSYKINQSASDYKFGNRFNAGLIAFRSFRSGMNEFSPNVGLLYENMAANTLNNVTVENTGGNALLAVVGIEARFNKMSVGLNTQLPLINKISDNQTNIVMRVMAHITYAF